MTIGLTIRGTRCGEEKSDGDSKEGGLDAIAYDLHVICLVRRPRTIDIAPRSAVARDSTIDTAIDDAVRAERPPAIRSTGYFEVDAITWSIAFTVAADAPSSRT